MNLKLWADALGCLAVLGLAVAVASCTEVHVKAGTVPGQLGQVSDALTSKRPSMTVLEGILKPGKSSKSEVLSALGRQTGPGAILLPIDRSPREVWSYYYEEATVRVQRDATAGESGRTFLFVYFDGDRYDGYMWFSSLP